MKKNIITAALFTVVTTVICGLLYPLAVTGLSQLMFRDKANGQLIEKDGKVIGSKIIGQAFTGPGYFHSRPSAAGSGNGYDSTASGGSNLGPTNKILTDRISSSVQQLHTENPSAPVPVDLVTTSGSGLDPDITPAAAEFQVPRVAHERQMNEADVEQLVAQHTKGRQFGFLGEVTVNVLQLNLDLDSGHPMPAASSTVSSVSPGVSSGTNPATR
jgi:K+-transporting ATPase ATPase C chain